MKLTDDSLEQFRASGLEAAAAVPEVPSILPLPLMEGPADPAERVEAIRTAVGRLAPFEPACVALPDRAGRRPRDRRRGDPRDRRGRARAGRPRRARARPARVRALLDVGQLARRGAALIDEAGVDVGLIFDSWQLYGEPLEEIERNRDRIYAVHLADWRDPTRNTNDRVLPGDGDHRLRPDPRGPALGRALRPRDLLRPRAARLALEGGSARARGARDRGDAEDAIERVCVVGGGVIGSLYAGHLARVCEVSVLCRREEHARALNEHGLRVSGRHEFEAQVRAATDPGELPEPELVIVATKTTELAAAAARLEGHWPGAAVMTVQNGLGAEAAFAGRLAHLGGHVHERHAPRGHARRVHPRHGDVARPLRRDPVRARRGGRRPDRRVGTEGAGVPRPAAGAVVEADLQRDRQRGRRAHRPAARLALRGAWSGRATSATSSTT